MIEIINSLLYILMIVGLSSLIVLTIALVIVVIRGIFDKD